MVSSNAVVAPVEHFSDIKPQLMKLLYDDSSLLVRRVLLPIENSTNIKRENLVYGLSAMLGLYLLVGSAAALLCNLIGFGYPAYASVKAVRTETKEDDTQWLIYWTVFAAFSLLDFFSADFMSVLPIYWLCKVVFLLYLALPQTRGAVKMYKRFVDPAVSKLDVLLARYNVH